MKWICLAAALLFPPEAATREPHRAPSRWSGKPDDRIPLPQLGVCPGDFEPWVYDTRRGAICVRRA